MRNARIMVKTAWYDLDMRSRRIERLSKTCETMFNRYLEQGNHDMAISYLDRFAKLEHTIQPYVEQMTGLKKLLQKGDKIATNPIPN